MTRSAFSRILLTALLVLVLTVPSVLAGEPGSSPNRGAAGVSLVDLLGRAWGGLVSLWMENGCILDPDGRCAAGQAAAPAQDNGCGADPDGGCAAGQSEMGLVPAQDNGCGLDPSGGCRSGS